jgi:hypothetical protein
MAGRCCTTVRMRRLFGRAGNGHCHALGDIVLTTTVDCARGKSKRTAAENNSKKTLAKNNDCTHGDEAWSQGKQSIATRELERRRSGSGGGRPRRRGHWPPSGGDLPSWCESGRSNVEGKIAGIKLHWVRTSPVWGRHRAPGDIAQGSDQPFLARDLRHQTLLQPSRPLPTRWLAAARICVYRSSVFNSKGPLLCYWGHVWAPAAKRSVPGQHEAV